MTEVVDLRDVKAKTRQDEVLDPGSGYRAVLPSPAHIENTDIVLRISEGTMEALLEPSHIFSEHSMIHNALDDNSMLPTVGPSFPRSWIVKDSVIHEDVDMR